MLSSPQAEKEPHGVGPTPNAALVREQLRRLLEHPLFANSKRYPVLLAYTVEQALLGHTSELKERTIGVEAFGREPTYDVNLDPVVRMTAAEVRKRLSQYYYNPDHAAELVIELPVGSYVPCFREPGNPQPSLASEPLLGRKSEPSREDVVTPGVGPAAVTERSLSRPTIRHWLTITGVLLAVFAGFGLGRLKLPRQPSSLERFWEPITATSSRITYCLGERKDSIHNQQMTTLPGVPAYGGLDLSDVTTLARSIVPLVPRNGVFRILPASDTGFTELREGPFVLIGAFDNSWTMRVNQDLPFGFEYDSTARWIVDRKNQQRLWTLQWQVSPAKVAQDYAIVARIHDRVTGQPVIILAGILGEGTEAAGEAASNPLYLEAILQRAPKNWDQRNLEAVIETQVIEGRPGPPTVIAVKTW